MSSPYANYPPFYHRRADTANRRTSYATVAASTGGSGPSTFQSLAGIANQPVSTSRPPTRGRMEDAGQPKGRWSGEVLRYEDGLGCGVHDQHPPFFTPSYLRSSRHVQRLRREWDAHLAELREVAKKSPVGEGSAVSAGTGKTHQHVHRGVAQEVVERPPQKLHDDGTHPLPSRWSEGDKMLGLEVLGDGTEVRFSGTTKGNDEAASIRTDHPMPREVGLYYFEVTIMSKAKDGLIGIGFSGSETTLDRLPGWEKDSWAYHGDDGFAFSCSANGKAYGPRFATQDVVGCGINFRTGNAFFTKNGVYLGECADHFHVIEVWTDIWEQAPRSQAYEQTAYIPQSASRNSTSTYAPTSAANPSFSTSTA